MSGSLDLTACTYLKYVSVCNNSLTSINVSGCTDLQTLYCYNNSLASIDVSGCVNLQTLYCYNNLLQLLNVSGNTKLTTLFCFNNSLTSLDVSQNMKLMTLYCYDNNLTSLNISKSTEIVSLYCYNNYLTSLNVSGNTRLRTLSCYNNSLKTLDISENTQLASLICNNNKLTFASLPEFTNGSYTYSPQSAISIGTNGTINRVDFDDLQAQYSVNGKITTFAWYYSSGLAGTANIITNKNGVFTFDSSLAGQSLYCEMTNTAFAGLTLKTENVTVSGTSTPNPNTPTAPSNFRSTSQTDNSVTFAWDAQSNLTGYILEYKKSSDTSWTTANPAPNVSATSETVTGLTANTDYNFRLTAKNTGGSAFSTINVATKAATENTPSAPANFTSNSQTDNSVTLSWSSQSGLTGYILEYKKSSDSNWKTVTSSTSFATTATITGLDANTSYDFYIRAKNSVGTSDWSVINNVITKTLEISPLSSPANFHSTATAQTTISLGWNNVNGATGYILQRKNNSGIFETIYAGTESRFVDSQLTANTQYEYRVTATGSDGNSGYTALTAKTAAKTDNNGKVIVDTPMFVMEPVYNNTGNSVTLEWTNLGNEYTYVLYKAGRVVVNFSNDNTYVDTNPSVSGVEGYALLAYHKATQQLSSVTMSVVHTTAKPVEITGYEVSSDGKFTLLWDADPGINYNIFRAGKNISGDLIFSNNNIGNWTDSNPLANNDYMLVAVYQDGQTYRATFSNIYNLKKPLQSQSANTALNAFWSNYDLDLIDDVLVATI